MKFFSVDSPLYKFISTFWVVVKLNFFWLLFSLPIVTIGASTTAAFAVGLKMADGSEGRENRSDVAVTTDDCRANR